MSEFGSEDLIESVQGPQSAWRRRIDRLLHRPVVAAAFLAVGLVAGSISGYVVGQSNPRTMGWIYGYSVGVESTAEGDFAGSPLDRSYGGEPVPLLTPEDLAALGEQVTRQFDVFSGRSAIPPLCGTSIGQPGTSNTGLSFPSRTFLLPDGSITELVWSHASDSLAAGALITLAAQAQRCPDASSDLVGSTTVTTSGLAPGIGTQHAVFTFTPLPVPAGEPVAGFVTVILVQLGADLVEVSFSSTVDVTTALRRVERIAQSALTTIANG